MYRSHGTLLTSRSRLHASGARPKVPTEFYFSGLTRRGFNISVSGPRSPLWGYVLSKILASLTKQTQSARTSPWTASCGAEFGPLCLFCCWSQSRSCCDCRGERHWRFSLQGKSWSDEQSRTGAEADGLAISILGLLHFGERKGPILGRSVTVEKALKRCVKPDASPMWVPPNRSSRFLLVD